MGDLDDEQAAWLLAEVLGTFAGTPDQRLREVMDAAVRHLHAFATEVQLRTEERRAAVHFLTAVGQLSSGERQEFELLSDVLGLSSLVEASNTPDGATLQTLTGPFYVAGSPERPFGASMLDDADDRAAPALLTGTITDVGGRPVEGATLDVWQNAANELYAIQDPGQSQFNLRGKYRSTADGSYEIATIRPVPYAIPDDGPVGDLLERTGRHPWRAAHIHLLVTHSLFVPLTTEVFDATSDYLDSDAVFGVAPALVVPFEAGADGVLRAQFDIVLRGAEE